MERKVRVQFESAASDRRTSRRYEISAKAAYRFLRKGRILLAGDGQTINMSAGGVLFQAESPASVGTEVEFSVQWPVLLPGGVKLLWWAVGRVVRAESNRVAVVLERHEFRTRRPKTD